MTLLPKTKRTLQKLLESQTLEALSEEEIQHLAGLCKDEGPTELPEGQTSLLRLCLPRVTAALPFASWFFDMDDDLDSLLYPCYVEPAIGREEFSRYVELLDADSFIAGLKRELARDEKLYLRGYAIGIAGFAGYKQLADDIYQAWKLQSDEVLSLHNITAKVMMSLLMLEDPRVHEIATHLDRQKNVPDEEMAGSWVLYLNRFPDRISDASLARLSEYLLQYETVVHALPLSLVDRILNILGGKVPENKDLDVHTKSAARLQFRSAANGKMELNQELYRWGVGGIALAQEVLEAGHMGPLAGETDEEHMVPSSFRYARHVVEKDSLNRLDAEMNGGMCGIDVPAFLAGLVLAENPRDWLQRMEELLGDQRFSTTPKLLNAFRNALDGGGIQATERYLWEWEPDLQDLFCALDAFRRLHLPLPPVFEACAQLFAAGSVEEWMKVIRGHELDLCVFLPDGLLHNLCGLVQSGVSSSVFSVLSWLQGGGQCTEELILDGFLNVWGQDEEEALFLLLVQLDHAEIREGWMVHLAAGLQKEDEFPTALEADGNVGLFLLLLEQNTWDEKSALGFSYLPSEFPYYDLLLRLFVARYDEELKTIIPFLAQIDLSVLTTPLLVDVVQIAKGAARTLEDLHRPEAFLSHPSKMIRRLFADWLSALVLEEEARERQMEILHSLARDPEAKVAFRPICRYFKEHPSEKWMFHYLLSYSAGPFEEVDMILYDALMACPSLDMAKRLVDEGRELSIRSGNMGSTLLTVMDALGSGLFCLLGHDYESVQKQFGGEVSLEMRLNAMGDDSRLKTQEFLISRLHELYDSSLAHKHMGRKVLVTPLPEKAPPKNRGLTDEEIWPLMESLSVLFVDEDTGGILCEVTKTRSSELVSALLEKKDRIYFSVEWV